MNLRIILNSFKADVKFIVRDPMLTVAFFAPVFIILLLRLIFPLFSNYIAINTGFQIDKYYTIAAITIVSVIPMLFGMIYAFILLDENDMHILQVIAVTPAGKKNFLYMRMIIPAIMSFILLLISTFITDPVPGEGWLRTIYVSFLLSLQSSFAFLFIGSYAENKVEGMALAKLYGIFLIAVPLGMILHHPWNYFAFFSPLYWISWAWVTPVITDSMIYGIISMIITLSGIFIFFRHFLGKHSD